MNTTLSQADQNIEQIQSTLNRIKDLKERMVGNGRDPATQDYGITLLEVKVHTIRVEVIARLSNELTKTGSKKLAHQLNLRIEKLTQLGNKE